MIQGRQLLTKFPPNLKQILAKHLLPIEFEQKRIVAILDEAFEGIDRAITNTEKNLANARELLESYLTHDNLFQI